MADQFEIDIYGSAFDPDDGGDRLALRRHYAEAIEPSLPEAAPRDPFAVLSPYLAEEFQVRLAGSVGVPDWLTPVPAATDLDRITQEATIRHLGEGGARAHASRVQTFVEHHVRGVPVMIGIDHVATYGAVEALASRYGSDLQLVVLDAHCDAVPATLRQALLDYARENPDVGYRHNPEFYTQSDRTVSMDCGSFVSDLVSDGIVRAENVHILGANDLPDPGLAKIQDTRVQEYLAHIQALRRSGVSVLTRDEILESANPDALVAEALSGIADRPVYISVDIDVGAVAAHRGSRFLDCEGLPEWALEILMASITNTVRRSGARLVGADLMEIDFYRAGAESPDGPDRTYDIALNILRTICELARVHGVHFGGGDRGAGMRANSNHLDNEKGRHRRATRERRTPCL